MALLLNRAVDVLVVKIPGSCRTHCYKPLRTIRSHPNAITCGDWIPGIFESIYPFSFEHQQTVLHDMGFNERKMGARFVIENIDAHIEGERVRQ